MDKELKQAAQELSSIFYRMRNMRPGESEMPKGITPSEMHILMAIKIRTDHGKEVRPSVLANYSRTTKSALSQTLKSLETKNFISRERSAKDSRVVLLALTDKGSDIIKEAIKNGEKSMEKLIEYLGADEIKNLTNTMKKIVEFQEKQGMVETKDAFPPPPQKPPFLEEVSCTEEGAPCA